MHDHRLVWHPIDSGVLTAFPYGCLVIASLIAISVPPADAGDTSPAPAGNRRPTHPPGQRRQFATRHEGQVWYVRDRDGWVREEGTVIAPDANFFMAYDADSRSLGVLLREIGYQGREARTEAEKWRRIGLVWNFLRKHARTAREGELSPPDRWPSLGEYAYFYRTQGELAWHACFSKAHLFASVLGRMVDRDEIAIASAHHTEGDAPPTSSHVYVAVRVASQWYYLDPAAVYSVAFPEFKQRHSVGLASLTTVDYEHPFKVLVLPGATLNRVPYLGADRRLAPAQQARH